MLLLRVHLRVSIRVNDVFYTDLLDEAIQSGFDLNATSWNQRPCGADIYVADACCSVDIRWAVGGQSVGAPSMDRWWTVGGQLVGAVGGQTVYNR